MATGGALLVVFCLVAGFGGRVSGGSFVDDERGAAAAVLKAAQGEIGVRELGRNAGKRVDQYNAYVGMRQVPWCASFVSWCFGQAGYTAPRTAWSPALFAKGRISATPLPGKVMGIYFASLGRIGHVGLVALVRGDYIQTIEGNTSPDGSREGVGVFRRLRHKRTICKYTNWL